MRGADIDLLDGFERDRRAAVPAREAHGFIANAQRAPVYGLAVEIGTFGPLVDFGGNALDASIEGM